MMVNGTTSSTQTSYSYDSAKTGDTVGKTDFLQLLVTQLQNQDPLDPMSNETFVAQLAQFNTLEQMQNLNSTMTAMNTLQVLTQTAAMVGRQVEATVDGETVSGTIQQVKYEDSTAYLVLKDAEGTQYTITADSILSVK